MSRHKTKSGIIFIIGDDDILDNMNVRIDNDSIDALDVTRITNSTRNELVNYSSKQHTTIFDNIINLFIAIFG